MALPYISFLALAPFEIVPLGVLLHLMMLGPKGISVSELPPMFDNWVRPE
jgi:hypothetical protein